MDEIKVTITNPDGTFSVFIDTGSTVTEHERYDTQEEAVAALTGLLGADKGVYTVIDRQAKTEVYRVAWLGQEKPAGEAAKSKTADK